MGNVRLAADFLRPFGTAVRGRPLIHMPRRSEVQIVVQENHTGHLYARLSCGCKINL